MTKVKWPDMLAATATSLVLIRNKKYEVVEQDRALYFGITWNADNLFVACGFKEDSEEIAVFDKSLTYVRSVPLKARNTHQIIWHAGRLFATLTERNEVAIVGPTSGELETFYHSGGSVLDGGIGEDHVNSIWFDANTVHIVEHRQSTRFNRPSRVRRADKSGRIISERYIGRNAHNIFVEPVGHEGRLFINDSTGERLTVVDLADGSRKHVNLGGFTRGFGSFDDGYVVGVSLVAVKDQRGLGNSQIVLLDKQLKVVDRLTLHGLGGLQDLRCLNADPSHNNLPFELTLES